MTQNNQPPPELVELVTIPTPAYLAALGFSDEEVDAIMFCEEAWCDHQDDVESRNATLRGVA